MLAAFALLGLTAGCSSSPQRVGPYEVTLPLLHGWFEGQEVLYVTTDVSHADVARSKGANFAPRLADALPRAGSPRPTLRTAVDKVYGITNFEQASVFASAPTPMGHLNRDGAYSPLWQLVKVTWADGASRRILKSEEDVLSAAEKGQVRAEPTDVVLNCPIVYRAQQGEGLPGVSIKRVTP